MLLWRGHVKVGGSHQRKWMRMHLPLLYEGSEGATTKWNLCILPRSTTNTMELTHSSKKHDQHNGTYAFFQEARPTQNGTYAFFQEARPTQNGTYAFFQEARPTQNGTYAFFQEARPTQNGTYAFFQEARPVSGVQQRMNVRH